MPSGGKSRPARRWGTFPTTADVGVWARGPSADALLEGLGIGLFSVMTDLRKVRPRVERTVRVTAEDPTRLVVAFLTELLVLQADDGFLVRDLAVRARETAPMSLVARARGEPFDPARHPMRAEVKAATFHALVFDPAHHRARVIVDI